MGRFDVELGQRKVPLITYTAAVETKAGWLRHLLGTIAAIAGVVVVAVNWERPNYEDGFYLGALLIFGGLLLRIEAAIAAGRSNR